jgi:hypothetical protein
MEKSDDGRLRSAEDERAIREGREAEARALAWARSPAGTPYGGTGAVRYGREKEAPNERRRLARG